jgi:hypothetical protein
MASTYRDFIEGIRDIADYLEEKIKDSQIITLDTEVEDEHEDLVLIDFSDLIDELLSNITGVHR